MAGWRPWLGSPGAGRAADGVATASRRGRRATCSGPGRPPPLRTTPPLLDRIGTSLAGRVEVPETQAHWDDYYLARHGAAGRGWIRQVDLELNTDGVLRRRRRRREQLSPLAGPERGAVRRACRTPTSRMPARTRSRTIDRHPAYLRPGLVGRALDAVRRPRLHARSSRRRRRQVDADAASLTLTAPAHSVVEVADPRWWRWLTLSGPDGQAVHRTGYEPGDPVAHRPQAAAYRITSTLGADARPLLTPVAPVVS